MTPEEETYQRELEQIATARTEQLRNALAAQEQVKAALREGQTAKSLTDAKNAIDRALEALGQLPGMENNQPPRFGGLPGTPVPQADVDNIKALLQLSREVERMHPEGNCAIGGSLAQSVCKPGADLEAAGFRVSMLGVIELMAKLGVIAPETVNNLKRDGEFRDQVLRVVATMPLDWPAAGVSQGLPFDWDTFLQACAA